MCGYDLPLEPLIVCPRYLTDTFRARIAFGFASNGITSWTWSRVLSIAKVPRSIDIEKNENFFTSWAHQAFSFFKFMFESQNRNLINNYKRINNILVMNCTYRFRAFQSHYIRTYICMCLLIFCYTINRMRFYKYLQFTCIKNKSTN